jgi:uncharacterized membrane protein YfhO
VEIQATLQRPGLLVVCDTFYPGWTARNHSVDRPAVAVPILQTNRIMRGVVLPAGEHRIVFSYRPPLFYVGAAISSGGWLTLLIGLVVMLWYQRRQRVASRIKAQA